MSTTYSKWEPHRAGLSVQRTVTTERWPLGFHWKRVRVEFINCHSGTDRARLCRALNGEPEPTPRLDEFRLPSIQHHDGRIEWVGGYRFSTEALQAELARREEAQKPKVVGCHDCGAIFPQGGGHKCEPWKLVDRRTGGERRKATNERGHSCDAKGHGTETCPACQAYWRGYRQAEHNAKPKRRGKR